MCEKPGKIVPLVEDELLDEAKVTLAHISGRRLTESWEPELLDLIAKRGERELRQQQVF